MNRRQKYGGAGKSRKAHFSAPLIFLPSFRWAANRGAQSKPVKPGQTDAAGQAVGQILCKFFNMNDLQKDQLSARSNSVKPGQTDQESQMRLNCQRNDCQRNESQSSFHDYSSDDHSSDHALSARVSQTESNRLLLVKLPGQSYANTLT